MAVNGVDSPIGARKHHLRGNELLHTLIKHQTSRNMTVIVHQTQITDAIAEEDKAEKKPTKTIPSLHLMPTTVLQRAPKSSSEAAPSVNGNPKKH